MTPVTSSEKEVGRGEMVVPVGSAEGGEMEEAS